MAVDSAGAMTERTRSVAVIGAGITGLAAAHRLREEAARREMPLQVTLLEADTRLGGSIHTLREQGFLLETGVDSFISEKPWGLALAKRLGLESELIGTQEQFRKTYVVPGSGSITGRGL